ncbi:unnamed protein product [Linum trigynum]|uniref:Uncharacterized protein n=1 Tax=Linum trigynum TaxID=586398 RepID=A0AAV2GQL5_9ROSI
MPEIGPRSTPQIEPRPTMEIGPRLIVESYGVRHRLWVGRSGGGDEVVDGGRDDLGSPAEVMMLWTEVEMIFGGQRRRSRWPTTMVGREKAEGLRWGIDRFRVFKIERGKIV